MEFSFLAYLDRIASKERCKAISFQRFCAAGTSVLVSEALGVGRERIACPNQAQPRNGSGQTPAKFGLGRACNSVATHSHRLFVLAISSVAHGDREFFRDCEARTGPRSRKEIAVEIPPNKSKNLSVLPVLHRC